MADIISQWLRPSYSMTSTYDDIRGNLADPSVTMPRLPESDWVPQPDTVLRGNSRGRWSNQSRGGRQAVDSWRSYSNDPNTLQSAVSGPGPSNSGFDPYSQVFPAPTHGNQRTNSSQNSPQATPYHGRSSVWHPNQVSAHTQKYQQQTSALASHQMKAQWPQYGQDYRDTAPSNLTRHESMRFFNGFQETQQVHRPAGGSWRGNSQSTFSHKVPLRPTRGADRPRGYTSSGVLPIPSIEHGQSSRNVPARVYEDIRHNLNRQSASPSEQIPVSPPPAPCASQAYLAQAHLQPERLKQPQRLLVILDLNGTLMLKPDYRKPKDFHIRPGAHQLLEYLFANHTVMVFTSSQPHNAEIVARGLFSEAQYDELAAIWARDKLDLTPQQYRAKVQVYKRLGKIWANNEIQSSLFPPGSGKWDQTNTILVDDSHLKALQEPHNLLQVTEFTGKTLGLKKKAYKTYEEQICQSLVIKLEVLKWQNDVSRLIWRWQTGKAEIPRVPGSNFFVDEKVDQKEQARKDLETAINIPTPRSPETTDSDESEDERGSVLLTADPDASFPSERKRSDSPIHEATFRDLLTARGKEKGSMQTPDSLDG